MAFRDGFRFDSGSSVSWGFQVLGCLLMLTVVMFLVSCGGGVDGPVSDTPTPTLLVLADDPTSIPRVTEVSSPASLGEEASNAAVESPAVAVELSFPRHGEVLPANPGDAYVYGELSRSGDCLRVSYADQVDPVATRDGLLVVWPKGFEAEDDGQSVEVFDSGRDLVASVGQSVRMSGRKVASEGEWDWTGVPGRCTGPFWLVGDEVSLVKGVGLVVESYGEVLFATSGEQRGPIVSELAGLGGLLRLSGRCLVVGGLDSPKEYLVVWPPGFRLEGSGENLSVLNGGGHVIAKLGDAVLLGGRFGKVVTAYSGECDGVYFKANSVMNLER